MLEHPEIGWIERTGYPSWLQETKDRKEEEPWNEQKPNGKRIICTDRSRSMPMPGAAISPG